MLTNENTHHPFSYFIGNEDVMDNLKLELIMLNGRKYICQDKDLPYIEIEIAKIKRTIKYNELLFIR